MKIIDLINNASEPFYSLEFFPPRERKSWPAFLQTVERLKALDPLFASVTYGAGGTSQDSTLELTGSIKELGVEPMAHLTCVSADADALQTFLEGLRTQDVLNVLALRGDAPQDVAFDWGKQEFKHASDLVQFVAGCCPDFGVAVAGYPGAHPESETFRSDVEWTKHKLDAGSDFIITQLFFDVREYVDFVDRLREMGCEKPVIPGILPIQSLASIRRILSLSGASIPGNLYLALEKAYDEGGDEAVKATGLEFAVQQIRELTASGAPGVHLYTLNKAEMCLDIVERVKG